MDMESYYENYENNLEELQISKKVIPNKKIGIIVSIIIIVILAMVLFYFFSSSPKNNISITTDSENQVSFVGSITRNGEIIDTFANSGRPIIQTINPNQRSRIIINSSGIVTPNSTGSAVILNSGGVVIAEIPPEFIIINDDGTITIGISPDELGIDVDDWNSGDTYEFDLQITIDDGEGTQTTFQVPFIISFEEFLGTGCLLLSRTSVNESTHNGILEIPIKLRLVCSGGDLKARTNWVSKQTGNVDVIFSNGEGSTLTPDDLSIYDSPTPNDYEAIIYYVPSSNSLGEKASFELIFSFQNTEQKIYFDIANENLEQCVKVETIDNEIKNENDNATIRITSNCYSDGIKISLCKNDAGCSGGAEGTISLSDSYFTLNKGKSKTINITRQDIAGIYGVNVYASIPGLEYSFISEKEIFVQPTNETIIPQKFSVSLFDKGSRDIVRVKNTDLAEEIEIETSICNLYKKSFGVDQTGSLPLLGQFSNTSEWTNDLYANPERYAGRGFYQTALLNTLPYISQARSVAYSIAVQENEKIKLAYENISLNQKNISGLVPLSEEALNAVLDLEDELGSVNDYTELNLTSQITGLVSSMTALGAAFTVPVAQTKALATSLTVVSGCGSADALRASASTTLAEAVITIDSLYVEITEGVTILNSIYSLYGSLDSLAVENEQINASGARSKSEQIIDKVNKLSEINDEILYYAELVLEEASINSFIEASENHAQAKYYLEQALISTEEASELITQITDLQNDATDELTVLTTDDASKLELTLQISSMLISLTTLIAQIESKMSILQEQLTIAQGQLDSAGGAAATECSASLGTSTACCTTAPAMISKEIGEITALQSTLIAQASAFLEVVGQINTLYQAWQMYEQLSADYGDELVKTLTKYNEFTEKTYEIETIVLQSLIDLESAILAAEHLTELEQNPSSSSSYIESFSLQKEYGEYNVERLNGIIGTLIQNGYVNGAYDGGVYTTKKTGTALFAPIDADLKEDCDNKITLNLIDFKTNLINDAKEIETTNPNLMAYFSFEDAEVKGIFEEQEASIIFSNSGIKNNSYATIYIKADNHNHLQNTIVDGEFGFFNVPDESVSEIVYPFHMKINVAPRKEANPSKVSVCDNGLLFGKTGEEVVPKTLINWNWEDIDSKSTDGKYLDATQFSILLSKKLSTINEFLSTISTKCPTNYAMDSLKQNITNEILIDLPEECFFPRNTYYYDDKPSIYYFLSNTAVQNQNYDEFFDEARISNASQLLEVLDFEVLLMRDGYGLEFQSDFAEYYSSSFLNSSQDFIDTSNGMYYYFKNSKKFYFSDEGKSFDPKIDFIIPDTGKYRVRVLADLENIPFLTSGGVNGKIIINLQLIEPIKENYSPFYYLPFDGQVGLKNDNGRRFYGTSLSNGSELAISSAQFLTLKNNQKDSLIKINSSIINNFFKLNSLSSYAGKIMDVSFKNEPKIIFSPTIATPLLFTLDGVSGNNAIMQYAVKKDGKNINPKTNNLFLLTALNGCKDFYGQNMLEYINKTPDFIIGDGYGFGFNNVDNSGKVFVTSTAYSPTGDYYALDSIKLSSINTTNTNDSEYLALEGIKGMAYNDLSTNDYISTIAGVFEAVKNESVCVSSLGDREIYWWSENYLFEKENIDEKKLIDLIKIAQSECIK